MHSHPGIVAGLATAIIAIAAEPAAADPGPVLPLPAVDVSIDLLPAGSPTTGTTEAGPTTRPTKTKTTTTEPTNTAPIKTITREQEVGTNGPSRGSAARRETSTPTPSPTPALRPAMPDPPVVAARPSGNTVDRWFDLATIVVLAVVASFGLRRRKVYAADLVDRAAGRPEFADPAGMARRRLRSVR